MSLKVRDSYSQKGVINVKCNAKIGEAYWQTSQENINVITKPSYMLESRSSSNTGKTITNELSKFQILYRIPPVDPMLHLLSNFLKLLTFCLKVILYSQFYLLSEHGNFQFAVTVIVLSQVFLCK